MSNVKRTERGWPGHYILSDRCVYHRNTLLECGEQKIVVSSVGNLRTDLESKKMETIGAFGRYYETMVFETEQNGPYIDADGAKECGYFRGLNYDNPESIPYNVDNMADEMHESVVAEVIADMENGKTIKTIWERSDERQI